MNKQLKQQCLKKKITRKTFQYLNFEKKIKDKKMIRTGFRTPVPCLGNPASYRYATASRWENVEFTS